VAQSIANLRAGDFVDDAKPEQLGLAAGSPGLITVTVSFKGGKTAGLRIGTLKGDDYNAQTVDSPQVFTAKKYSLERVAHLPQDVRDKTIFKFKADDLDTVSVQQGTDTLTLKRADKAWKAEKVDNADDNKVKALADSFENMSGSSFVLPGAPELASLAKPKVILTVKPKTGAPVVVKVGDTKGDEVIVQKTGGAAMDPMWVKKYLIDRYQKKPAELTKDKK
jgi:hypothetical protein